MNDDSPNSKQRPGRWDTPDGRKISRHLPDEDHSVEHYDDLAPDGKMVRRDPATGRDLSLEE